MKYAWNLHLHPEISSFLILFGASSFQLPLQPWDHCEPSRPGGSCEYSILEKRVTEPTPARVWTIEFCHGVTALAPDPAKSQGFWDLGAGWNQNIPPEESSPTPKSNGSGEVGVESPQIPAPILQQSLSPPDSHIKAQWIWDHPGNLSKSCPCTWQRTFVCSALV